MPERIEIHPTHPQTRLIERAARVLDTGGLVLLPTDADYVFAWALDAREAEARVIRLRALDTRHPFTLLCARLSEIGRLAKLNDSAFRLVKSLVPGPYTFLLPASGELPRRLKPTKRQVIGCRISAHPAVQAVLAAHAAPLVISSVVLTEESPDRNDGAAIAERLIRQVDLMLDAGICPAGPTSIIDLTGARPVLTREGANPPDLGSL